MKHNVGSFDAAARTLVGLAILALGHHERSWWALAGFVPILVAAIEFCPIYWLFGWSTCFTDEPLAETPSRSSVRKV